VFGLHNVPVLLIFALVLFGPKRLPEIARYVGRAVAEIRRVSANFEREIRDVAEPFQRELAAAADPEEADMLRAEHEAGVRTYAIVSDHSQYTMPTDGQAELPPLRPAPPRSL
jgi:Sec-independent protein translocase protein TatA